MSNLDVSWIPDFAKIRDFVGEHAFEDPDDFVRALRPRSGLWDYEPRDWIFRGLADVNWPLLPSAHRPEPWLPFRAHSIYPYQPAADIEEMRQIREAALVREFYEAANASGLELPIAPVTEEDWNVVRHQDWPSNTFFSLVALAQHHRVPTRLLDWTRRGLVAAYFAAQELPAEPRAAKLCVWALNRRFIEAHGVQAEIRCHVRVRSAHHASNPNLHAQSGLFTFNNYDKGSTDLRALEYVVSELAVAVSGQLGGSPVMRRLTLPREHAPSVLKELDLEDVSARTLFPDFAGVVEYLRFRKSCP